jgi:hypothetical protein
MFINGVRFCDVCNEHIEVGARYVICIIPKEGSLLFMSRESDIEDTLGLTGDAEGFLKLDVCLGCKLDMGLSGEIAT